LKVTFDAAGIILARRSKARRLRHTGDRDWLATTAPGPRDGPIRVVESTLVEFETFRQRNAPFVGERAMLRETLHQCTVL